MKAFLTGITGQIGSYLAEQLLEKGFIVHGLVRRSSSISTSRIDHIYKDPHDIGARLFLHYGDMSDGAGLANLINKIRPDYIFNLAAQSHVKVSFEIPEYTEDITATGVIRLLEVVRHLDYPVRLLQSSSSEMFGNAAPPQSETTPMSPNSPYAIAKYCAYRNIINYREGYDIFACNSICFNNESPRRPPTFVTRKITQGVARIKLGLQDKLYLGNLEAKRDWGFSPEYSLAMIKIIELDTPTDIVIGTGETHTVQEFVEEAFNYVKLDWRKYVDIDKRYYRPTEVNVLQADTRKAEKLIDWKPKVKFKELIKIMVDADIKELGGIH